MRILRSPRFWFVLGVNGVMIAGLLMIVWVYFVPDLPNRPKAKAALLAELGVSPEEVSDIRYDRRPKDMHGWEEHHFRFRYPSEEWLSAFLKEYKRGEGPGVCSPCSRSWWELQEERESYYKVEFDWRSWVIEARIDRPHRFVYASKFSP